MRPPLVCAIFQINNQISLRWSCFRVFAHHSLVWIPAGQTFLLILFLCSLQIQKGLHQVWAHHNPLTNRQPVLVLLCSAVSANEGPGSANEREVGWLLHGQEDFTRTFPGSSELPAQPKGFPYVPPPPAFVAKFEFLLRDACVLESVQVHLPLLEVPVCLRHHVPARRLHHHVSSVSDDQS